MSVNVVTGSWVSAKGWGDLSKKPEFVLGEPVLPDLKTVFETVPTRYARFDDFTRMGCVAAALAYQAADDKGEPDRTGMIFSSKYDTSVTDSAYYDTTIEQEGLLSSPNMFSYTLPVITLGECSVVFGFNGPTYCMGEDTDKGMQALTSAMRLIEAGAADSMLAGWVDDPPAEYKEAPGAVFVLLQKDGQGPEICIKDGIVTESKKNINSIVDLFIA